MMEEFATIRRIEGDVAWVQAQSRQGCGSCSANGSCGTGTLARLLGRREALIRVHNSLHAEAGEQVVLGIEEAALLRGALLMYMLPLLGLMGGGWLGAWLVGAAGIGSPQLAAIAGAATGFYLAFRFLRQAGADELEQARFQPVMLRRTGSSEPGSASTLADGTG